MKPFTIILLLLYIYVGCLLAFNTDECNTKKKCITFPTDCHTQKPTECEYLMSYAPSNKNSDIIDIELATKNTGNDPSYISVGFSNDREMGDEPVSACSFVRGNVTVHVSKNLGKSNQPSDENPLKLINTGTENGRVYCKFQQDVNKNLSTNQELPDLTQPYFLFIVRGPIHNPIEASRIGMHELSPDSIDYPRIIPNQIVLSDALINKESVPVGATPPTDYRMFLVRIHGLLMILSWLFLLAIGIFSARYMRELWPTTTPMGLKIWFHIHRTLNFAAVVCLVVSSILVFIAKDFTWKGPWFGRDEKVNTTWGAYHSLAGLIAVIFGVAQPFIALTRCGVNHPQRPIFNWVHRIIGLSGFVLASVAIFIAVTVFKRYWADPTWSLISLIVYFLLIIGVVIALEWYRIKYQKPPHPGGFEMKTKDGRQNYQELHSSATQLDDKKLKQATIGSFAAVVAVAFVFTGILLGMLFP